MSHLQPHEGIVGLNRPDDLLLNTSTSALDMRKTVMFLTYNLHRALYRGPRYQNAAGMEEPSVGDLVVVTDYLPQMDHASERAPMERILHSLGYLVDYRLEWWHTDEEWQQLLNDGDYEPDEDRPTDWGYYVQYGRDPKDICRWVDCGILRVPRGIFPVIA